MTVEELLVGIYEGAGEPTDLDPYDESDEFDIDSAGAVKMLGFLNRAYQRLTNWKLANGTIIRFSSLNRRSYFISKVFELTVSSASGTSIVLDATASDQDDRYESWTLEFGDERRIVIAYDGDTRTALLTEAFSEDPETDDDVTLQKRFMLFVEDDTDRHPGEVIAVDPLEIVAIQSVRDISAGVDLARMERTESQWDLMVEDTATPGMFRQIAGGIEFDSVPDDDEVFLMCYYGKPEALSTATQEPQIPLAWHEPLLYLAIWITMKRDRATDEAYSLKRDIADMIAQTVQESERAFDSESGQLYIKD